MKAVQKNISKQSRIFKSLVDLEEIDLAINTFKNQEFRVAETTKTVRNVLKNRKNLTLFTTLILKNSLIEVFHQNQYIVKPSVVPNQRIVIQNCPYPPSLKSLATVKNLIAHPNHPNVLLI